MSHFTVLIVGENPEKQLEPFEESPEEGSPYLVFRDGTEEVLAKWEKYKDSGEYASIEKFASSYFGYDKKEDGKYGYMGNPNRKWDWYQLGGRWTGFFNLKKTNRMIRKEIGSPGLMTKMAPEGTADAAYKRDIDFEGMRLEAANKAQETYRTVRDALDGTIPTMTIKWKDLIDEKNEKYNKLNIDEKRAIFHSQAAILTWKAAAQKYKDKMDEESKELYSLFLWGDLENFQMTEEEYVQRARNNAITTFAVLMDGKWYERGKMGWWAMVADEKSDWDVEFSKLLDSVSDDTLLSVYDCHI